MSYTPAKRFENDFYNPYTNSHGSEVKSSYAPHVSCIVKIFKLVINLIVLILYRIGEQGDFLGIGGKWDLDGDNQPDFEIAASGVFVGYFIYTLSAVISFCLELRRKGDDDDSFDDYDHLPNDNSIIVDLLMNLLGTFLWLGLGGTCVHHWKDYPHDVRQTEVLPEKLFGIALGGLCIIEGGVFFVDSILAFRIHWEQNH